MECKPLEQTDLGSQIWMRRPVALERFRNVQSVVHDHGDELNKYRLECDDEFCAATSCLFKMKVVRIPLLSDLL
jgi:predicted site-specific integrase-resolvase